MDLIAKIECSIVVIEYVECSVATASAASFLPAIAFLSYVFVVHPGPLVSFTCKHQPSQAFTFYFYRTKESSSFSATTVLAASEDQFSLLKSKVTKDVVF